MNDKTLKQYHLMNNAIGWLIGIIACVVYIMTAEATASWWDCGEYTATAFKLQVGHPPGAPTFQLFGRLFTLFTDPYHAAFAVNVMSAICSGLGIMFLYWTITLLGKKLLKLEDLSLSNSKVWAVFASGVIGALAYTFTDTYWFSAVESEVYAMSSFFTAIVFWAILKWEEQAEDKHSLRWVVLISFLVGIAIGVHLLNLLTIPAIVYVVYFKKYPKTTIKGFIISGAISLAILAVVLWGVIPGIVNLSSDFDVFFVNKLHLGFNSGTVVFFLLVAVFVVWGIWNNSHMKQPGKIVNIIVLAVVFAFMFIAKLGAGSFSFAFFLMLCLLGVAAWFIIKSKNRPVVNAAIMSFLMLVIGYSTFFILVIRANTNTPLNENAPKDAVAMRAYLGREQYGQTPLLTGPYYTAGYAIDVKNDYPKYIRTKDAEGRDFYELAAYAQVPVYREEHTGFFPRMYSSDNDRKHPLYYKLWAGEPPTVNGQELRPTFAQNLKFFHGYQMGWMYWRYFMWNFAGRQNDIQGHHFDPDGTLNLTDGNWISGINFVDEHRLGPQTDLPNRLATNKARNKYYMLPLLLGMIGLIYHCIRSRKDAFVVFLMFFMTGIAIAVYLNMPPNQPRERDYAFVGSFYFFAVWIGLGVYALYDWLSEKFDGKPRNSFLIAGAACVLLGLLLNGGWFILTMVGAVLIVASLVRLPKPMALVLAFVMSSTVPVILCAENWDDHDRSHKTAARDFARNYLSLTDPNSIVITFGDNDTFPLWYAQEVEGCRPDVRILNYTLSGMHWYVEQLYNKLYDSDALPFTFPKDRYGLKYESFHLRTSGPRMEVTEALAQADGSYIPTNKFRITLDKPKLVANHIITAEQADTIPDAIDFDIMLDYRLMRGPGGETYVVLYRNEMMILDLLGTNRFERPINIMNVGYIANVFPVIDFYNVDDGMLSMLVPYPVPSSGRNSINRNYTDRTTDYFLKGVRDKKGNYTPLKWGNLNQGIYIDPVSKSMADMQRQTFVLLADRLAQQGDTVSAKKMLEIREQYFPTKYFPNDHYAELTLYTYSHVGDQIEAHNIMCDIFDYYYQEFVYAQKLSDFNPLAGRKMYQGAVEMMNRLYVIRSHSNLMANPYTGKAEAALTDEGEKQFVNANPENAQRLAKMDQFFKQIGLEGMPSGRQ